VRLETIAREEIVYWNSGRLQVHEQYCAVKPPRLDGWKHKSKAAGTTH